MTRFTRNTKPAFATQPNRGTLNLDVSEWYYILDGLIDEIIAYYHIGDIRDDRQIEDYG